MVTVGTLGTAGIDFDITENDVSVSTGTVTQEHSIAEAVAALTVNTDDLVYSISGSVGTTQFTFSLNSISNQSGSGYSTQVIRNNDGDITDIKMLVIYNTHATNNIIYGSPASNSFFGWGDTDNTQIIRPGQAAAFVFGTDYTISTNSDFTLVGSSASTTFQMFILGT